MRKFWAWINRSFTDICPKCDKHYFGHHGFATNIKIEHVHYRIVCAKCAKQHKK